MDDALKSKLNLIKLKIAKSSVENLHNCLIGCLRDMCELVKRYPTYFENVMASNWNQGDYMDSLINGQLSKDEIYCDLCDINIELINRDAEYTIQMHNQSSQHTKILEDIQNNFYKQPTWKSVIENDDNVVLKKIDGRADCSNSVAGNYCIKCDFVYCGACDRFLYDYRINEFHVGTKNQCILDESSNAVTGCTSNTKPTVWNIIDDRFVNCIICKRKFDLSGHTSSDTHESSVTYKKWRAVRIDRLGYLDIWKNLSDESFNHRLLFIRKKEALYCAVCDEIMGSHSEYDSHIITFQHQTYISQLRKSFIFSKIFGVIDKPTMWYCVLCHRGLCNFVEYDWHVSSPNSDHSQKLTEFRETIFEALGKQRLRILSQTTTEQYLPRYSLDSSIVERVDFTMDRSLKNFVFIYMDEMSCCTLCDEIILDTDHNDDHVISKGHTQLLKNLKRSLRNSDDSAAGIIQKEDISYCVICHVGLATRFTSDMHCAKSSSHFERLRYCRIVLGDVLRLSE